MTQQQIRSAALGVTGIAFFVLLASTGCSRPSGPSVSFSEAIQPILSENCYHCHGLDSGSRKANLRLDRAEFAYATRGKAPPAIVPGRPDSSLLVQKIEAKDADERMPPPEAHKILSPQQIALLRRWVEEGAKYEEHWAFTAPVSRPAPQPVAGDPHASWVVNDIDRFVLARLGREQLSPSEPADRATLIRRVTYDLTGLPPTPEEVSAFIADTSTDAYEKVVNRLLASSRYGEHRARYWLDLARYGDTHGLHLDNYRSIWPFRDYVIKSYNENKPFDEFIREQLAGDLLPAKNIDQQVASAYIRAGISSGEAGTLPEQLRVNNQRERVEAFGAAFLGLTVGCAVCHDHKFDPITQRDFYRLTAFFNNLTENPSNEDRADWPPFIRIPRDSSDRAAYDSVLDARAVLLRKLGARRADAQRLVTAWLAESSGKPRGVPASDLQVRLRFDEQRGATFLNSAPHAEPASIVATGDAPQWGEDVWLWPSMRMDTTTRIEIPGAGDFDTTDAFSVATWLMPRREASGDAATGAIVSRMTSTGSGRGWELAFEEEKEANGADKHDRQVRLSFNLVHDGHAALRVRTKHGVMMRGRWNHLLAIYDGAGAAAGVRLYVDSRPVEVEVLQDTLRKTRSASDTWRLISASTLRATSEELRVQPLSAIISRRPSPVTTPPGSWTTGGENHAGPGWPIPG